MCIRDSYWGELEKEARDFLPELSWKKLLERLQAGEAVLDLSLIHIWPGGQPSPAIFIKRWPGN